MIKIEFNSRYYDSFQKAKSIINYDKLFERGYNEDKCYYYTIYSNLINHDKSPIEVSKEYLYNLNIFFERELFNEKEKKILIDNLLTHMKTYTNHPIRTLGMGEHKIAQEIMKQNKFTTWGEFTVDLILDNKDKFSTNTRIIINYLISLKDELLKTLNNYFYSSFQFKNNFDKIGTDNVKSYFTKELVNTGYLSENDLEKYLLQAFELKSIPDKKFKLKNVGTKNAINRIFYLYYRDIASKPFGKQKDYAGLLGEYFEGYKTETVSTNFSKIY